MRRRRRRQSCRSKLREIFAVGISRDRERDRCAALVVGRAVERDAVAALQLGSDAVGHCGFSVNLRALRVAERLHVIAAVDIGDAVACESREIRRADCDFLRREKAVLDVELASTIFPADESGAICCACAEQFAVKNAVGEVERAAAFQHADKSAVSAVAADRTGNRHA